MNMIRDNARYYQAPAGLEQRIRASLRRENEPPQTWRWLAIAATLLLVASLAANMALLRSRVNPQELMAQNIVSAHIRSLAGEHLLDVPSSDHHTVKPWFNGKVDFSPEVKEVEGFTLLGGRLEYFEGRPAAALIYGRRKHIINLFTWPDATAHPAAEEMQNGYHLQSWSANGMVYWAVSDLNEAELRQFVTGYQK